MNGSQAAEMLNKLSIFRLRLKRKYAVIACLTKPGKEWAGLTAPTHLLQSIKGRLHLPDPFLEGWIAIA